MNERQARAEFLKFKSELPETAYMSVSMNLRMSDEVMECRIYPIGIASSSNSIVAEAETLEQLVAAARVTWDEYKSTHMQHVIRKIALRIIQITADTGQCTDAALRMADDMRDADIDQYGEAAVEEANKLAANGPFSIVRSAANAA